MIFNFMHKVSCKYELPCRVSQSWYVELTTSWAHAIFKEPICFESPDDREEHQSGESAAMFASVLFFYSSKLDSDSAAKRLAQVFSNVCYVYQPARLAAKE